VTAVAGGRSVDTSMGYTPLEGLMMATRGGSVDPGILLELLADGRLDAPGQTDAHHHPTGLLANGGSANGAEVEALADAGDERAALALEMFARRAAAGVAAAATSLPSLDALIFTAGIGEHSARLRGAIADRLGGLGIPRLDSGAANADEMLATSPQGVSVLRIEAREDLVIARATAARIGRG
jgi:acetate kinase